MRITGWIGCGLWVAAAATGLALTGCATDGTRVPVTGADSPEAFRKCAVDIENFAGEVRLSVDPTLQAPQVRCYAYEPGAADDLTFTTKTAAVVTAVVSQSTGGTVFRVTTKAEEGEEHARAVTLSLRVPNCDGLRIRNHGGLVLAEGVAGSIDIENMPGEPGVSPDVVVRTERVIAAPVTITAMHGSIDLALSGDSAGRLDLSASGGPLLVQVERGRLEGVRSDGGTYSAVLNRGEDDFKLRTGGKELRVQLLRDRFAKREPTATKAPEASAPADASEASKRSDLCGL